MNKITTYRCQEYPNSNISLQENFLQRFSSIIRDFFILIGIIINIVFAIFSVTSGYPIFGIGFFISTGFEVYLFLQMKASHQYSLFQRDIQQANREMSHLLHIFENQLAHFSDSFQNSSNTFQSHNRDLGLHIKNLIVGL